MSNWIDKRLEEAMKKKLPEWYEVCNKYNPPGPNRKTLLKGELCPECIQETIFCCRNDFGHVDCEPRFAHICVNDSCNYFVEQEIQGVSYPDLEASRSYCPWC